MFEYYSKNCLAKHGKGDFDVLKKCKTPQVCPNFYKMLQLALTLPISFATYKRSFSAMRKIKSWLRTSAMEQNRFNKLSILFIKN